MEAGKYEIVEEWNHGDDDQTVACQLIYLRARGAPQFFSAHLHRFIFRATNHGEPASVSYRAARSCSSLCAYADLSAGH